MAYDYIKQAYQVDAKVGQRVRHNETKRLGWIAREDRSAGHYIQVRFDGDGHALPCHPLAIDFPPNGSNRADAFDAGAQS